MLNYHTQLRAITAQAPVWDGHPENKLMRETLNMYEYYRCVVELLSAYLLWTIL